MPRGRSVWGRCAEAEAGWEETGGAAIPGLTDPPPRLPVPRPPPPRKQIRALSTPSLRSGTTPPTPMWDLRQLKKSPGSFHQGCSTKMNLKGETILQARGKGNGWRSENAGPPPPSPLYPSLFSGLGGGAEMFSDIFAAYGHKLRGFSKGLLDDWVGV